MPKREDEYWAGTKEPKGRGLCPFCGSPNVFYSKHYERWTCGNCEKSFPSPSYGPGGDFGKEARWFGKTTAKMRRREFAEARAARQKKTGSKASNTGYPFDPDHVGYYKGEYRGRRIKVGGFTARKAFLIFLLIACLAAAVWAGYLLFTNRTDPVIGTIILVADIGVLIWNISVLRKWRVGTGTIVSIAVITALLGGTIGAFAGIKPFSTVKNGLVAGCQRAPSQPSEQLPPSTEQQPPPASTYPADISGHVIITDKVIAKYSRDKPDTIELNPLEGKIWWIIDISVRNKAYEDVITASYNSWKIVDDDKVYDAQRPFMSIQSAYPMSVPMGETGETTIRFPVPNTLKVSSAKLCYQGQEPYSYGQLTGGDKVAVYDWDMGLVRIESNVARVVGGPGVGVISYDLVFELEPTDLAVADKAYEVELYEKGIFRDTKSVSWSQPELNVKKKKWVGFPLSYEETQAYWGEDISHIFSVKVFEWKDLRID